MHAWGAPARARLPVTAMSRGGWDGCHTCKTASGKNKNNFNKRKSFTNKLLDVFGNSKSSQHLQFVNSNLSDMLLLLSSFCFRLGVVSPVDPAQYAFNSVQLCSVTRRLCWRPIEQLHNIVIGEPSMSFRNMLVFKMLNTANQKAQNQHFENNNE